MAGSVSHRSVAVTEDNQAPIAVADVSISVHGIVRSSTSDSVGGVLSSVTVIVLVVVLVVELPALPPEPSPPLSSCWARD